MKVYLELVFILNFLIDLFILMSVKILLKRNTNMFKLILSSFIGSLTIILLFVKLTSLELFIIKLLFSIIMNSISFNYKNIKYLFKNIVFFYITSILLGGFIYFINLEFKNSIIINYLLLLLLSPIIIYFYIKEIKSLKTNYNNYYNLEIHFIDNKVKKCIGYLDTGNTLKDPYKKRPIIILNYFKNNYPKILVPCFTISSSELLECFKVKEIYINNKIIKNVLIGMSKNKINIDGVDCILNPLIIKENI